MAHQNVDYGNMEILQIPLDGSEEELIVKFPAGRLDLRYWDISPSGEWLAFFALSPGRSKAYLHAINIPDKNHISHPQIYADPWGSTVGWTPDEQGIMIADELGSLTGDELGIKMGRVFLRLVDLQTGSDYGYTPPRSYLDEYGVSGGDAGLFWDVK